MATSGGDTWRGRLPALLLTGCACCQILLASRADLSPWKGGGFGMFASSDGTAARHVRIVVQAPERSEEVAIQPSFEHIAARAQLFPSRRLMWQLAHAVAARERRYSRPVTDVTVQIWRTVYEPGSLRATERLLREQSFGVFESADRVP